MLIVDDDAAMRSVLAVFLTRQGYRVQQAATAVAGLSALRRGRTSLVLLDVGLPDLGGVEACRKIRETSGVPIIFLSGKGEELQRVLALEAGGDDYVVKPFMNGELLARIRARLRRFALHPAGGVEIGAARFDRERRTLWNGERLIELTPLEFELLSALVEAAGRPLSRPELLERVWGHDRAAELVTRTVDQQVARLRRKFGAEAARLATVARVGYRLRL